MFGKNFTPFFLMDQPAQFDPVKSKSDKLPLGVTTRGWNRNRLELTRTVYVPPDCTPSSVYTPNELVKAVIIVPWPLVRATTAFLRPRPSGSNIRPEIVTPAWVAVKFAI